MAWHIGPGCRYPPQALGLASNGHKTAWPTQSLHPGPISSNSTQRSTNGAAWLHGWLWTSAQPQSNCSLVQRPSYSRAKSHLLGGVAPAPHRQQHSRAPSPYPPPLPYAAHPTRPTAPHARNPHLLVRVVPAPHGQQHEDQRRAPEVQAQEHGHQVDGWEEGEGRGERWGRVNTGE